MRKNDIVLFGIYPKDNPSMLAEDIDLLEQYVERSG